MTPEHTRLAAALLNTKHLPSGLLSVAAKAKEARAYHCLAPYPEFAFGDWKTEDRGPLPRCLTIARKIARRGARWLFGKPVQILVPGNTTLEQFLQDAWESSRLGARMVAAAEKGAIEGGVVLKFSYHSESEQPLRFQVLSLVDQCRLYYHPHDREQLLMARIQYPFVNPEDAEAYWYREEWTAEAEVHYQPVKAADLGSASPDTYEGWQRDMAASGRNPFGLIPLHHVRNIECEDCWGEGDLWELYRVLDRIHLCFHLMDRSNQFDSQLNPIFADADVEEDDLDRPLQPGQPMQINTREEGGPEAKVIFPPSGNALRPAMMEYARELARQLHEAAGSVQIDQAEITNKGNLTTAVLEQIYLPQIELTEEKRKAWGEGGLVPFFQKVARGLAKIGRVPGVTGVTADKATYTPTLKWSPHFPLSDEEKTVRTARIVEQETAGYVTHERAIQEIAQVEGRDDVEELLEDLEREPRPSPTEDEPAPPKPTERREAA